jgi:hypothetical protein
MRPNQSRTEIAKWDAVRITDDDQVAVAVQDIEGLATILCGDELMRLLLPSPVPMGHKFALFDMPMSTEIRKYGHVIGVLSQAVASGEHIHVHNLTSRRGKAS